MITPDELAEQLTPPAGTGRTYNTQLLLSDRGMDLAETILDETRRSPLQDLALDLLVRALQVAYGAVEADASATPDPPAAAAAVDDAAAPDPALVLDVGVWRLGVRTARLHPLTRLAGLVLADYCGPSGRIPAAQQPTLRDLSEQTGLQMNVLHTHLQDLTAHGWITRQAHADAGGGRRFAFQLRLPHPHR